MSLEKSEAVVLKAHNWSESSRTVVFFSRRYGRIALVDKGGRRVKSRRGRIMPFARLEVSFYQSEKETSGYLSDIEVLEAFTFERDGSLGRLAYGSAACEVLNLLLPEEEPQPGLFSYFVGFLKTVDLADKRSLPAVFLSFFLRIISGLGYHPSLTHCGGCGKDLIAGDLPAAANGDAATVAFYPDRGGVVCGSCQSPGDYYIPLSRSSMESLAKLQTASLTEAAAVALGFAEAGLLIEALTKFLAYQTGMKTDLKSLEFLEKLKNTRLTE